MMLVLVTYDVATATRAGHAPAPVPPAAAAF